MFTRPLGNSNSTFALLIFPLDGLLCNLQRCEFEKISERLVWHRKSPSIIQSKDFLKSLYIIGKIEHKLRIENKLSKNGVTM